MLIGQMQFFSPSQLNCKPNLQAASGETARNPVFTDLGSSVQGPGWCGPHPTWDSSCVINNPSAVQDTMRLSTGSKVLRLYQIQVTKPLTLRADGNKNPLLKINLSILSQGKYWQTPVAQSRLGHNFPRAGKCVRGQRATCFGKHLFFWKTDIEVVGDTHPLPNW